MKRNNDILIAEDDSIIALDIRKYLENLGYQVSDVVCKGEELLAKARMHKPALIISDINLKGELDGIEAIARLSESSSIPYIFVTAYDDYKRVIEIYHLEPLAFLKKPINYSELSDCIRSNL
ncbi:MAG: response regulator [Ignavibacteriaceae bacterium]